MYESIVTDDIIKFAKMHVDFALHSNDKEYVSDQLKIVKTFVIAIAILTGDICEDYNLTVSRYKEIVNLVGMNELNKHLKELL